MEDNSTLQHHDIVSGAMITLTIWRAWTQLIQACVKGDIAQVVVSVKLGQIEYFKLLLTMSGYETWSHS